MEDEILPNLDFDRLKVYETDYATTVCTRNTTNSTTVQMFAE